MISDMLAWCLVIDNRLATVWGRRRYFCMLSHELLTSLSKQTEVYSEARSVLSNYLDFGVCLWFSIIGLAGPGAFLLVGWWYEDDVDQILTYNSPRLAIPTRRLVLIA